MKVPAGCAATIQCVRPLGAEAKIDLPVSHVGTFLIACPDSRDYYHTCPSAGMCPPGAVSRFGDLP